MGIAKHSMLLPFFENIAMSFLNDLYLPRVSYGQMCRKAPRLRFLPFLMSIRSCSMWDFLRTAETP